MSKSLADLIREALDEIQEIPVDEVQKLLEQPDRDGWEILDVREPEEFAAGRLPGARPYPRGMLEVRADLHHPKRDPWLGDRNRKLILYCGGGHRSALAAQTLSRMGFETVRSMAEGWAGWKRRGLPEER